MSYISDYQSSPFGLFQTSTDASNTTVCGTRFATDDGRQVALFLNGSVALASGVLAQHSPLVANHQGIAVTTFTAASSTTGQLATVVATLGATLSTVNQYQGGYAIVDSGTGIGQTLKIQSNTAAALSTAITIVLEDSPAVALDNTSTLCLIAQPFTGVVINPTTATAAPAGVNLYPVLGSTATVNQYGFLVTQGVTSCLSDASIAAIGLGIIPSTSTAGSVTVATATGNKIGSAYQAGVSAKSRAIKINL